MIIKPEKCNLFQKEVLYLSHVVSEEGVRPDPEKTARVVSWPTPNCVTEIQAFMGLANYYRHFIRGFAHIF